MFKSIQKSGRIAAVAIGLIAALSPLAAPPAALAGGSVPTPELEKSYSFKTSSDHSNASKVDTESGYCYLFDRDDEYNLKKVSLINLDDGSITPVDIPKKSLDSTKVSCNDQLSWIEGSNLVVFSPEKQSRTVHSLEPGKNTQDYAWISENGETACVEQHDSDDNYSYALYDLKTDNKMQVYHTESDWSYIAFSNDGGCFYAASTNADKSTVTLKVFDTKTGSTKSNTTHVNKVTDDIEIGSVSLLPDSKGLILQGESFLIKADRDANLSTISDDEDHAFANDYSSWACDYYPVYIGNGSSDLFEEDDDDYYLNEQDASLGVIDLQNGNTISSIAFPFGDGRLCDISHDGSVLLGRYSDDDRSSACLVDAQTGAKSEFDSHWCDQLSFMNGDRKILATYFDDDDSSILHVNIYKSNIPHSLPEDVLYFVQTHLPFVIGGGVAIVLVIGGVIVVLCVRKKRAKTTNGAVAAAPKPQRKQRRRQKRTQQNAVVPAAPTMPAAPTEPTRFCRHCGTPLVPEAQFCPTCGQKVD